MRLPMRGIAGHNASTHAPAMFVVTEADVAAIRAVYEQRGELSAAVELRRRFPGITDDPQARRQLTPAASTGSGP
jgi:hypothetical protein